MLQVTVLGCGSSLGVPVIGCDCTVCTSQSPYNKRTRSSILIEGKETRILVDFGFEIREQLLKAGVKRLDGAILTHDHADHVSGIDNLKAFSYLQKKPLEIFTDYDTAQIIETRYKYLFNQEILIAKPIDFFAKLNIGSLNIQFFKQNHSYIPSLGIRIGDFVYSSDVANFPEESKPYLQNMKLWIIDCADYNATAEHAGLEQVLQWREEYKPERIFLTNMRHKIDYHEISKILPPNIFPLYDGCVLYI